MGWDTSIVSDPSGFSQGGFAGDSGQLTDVSPTRWDLPWPGDDQPYAPTVFKFYSFADDLNITVELINDEQCNTLAFDSCTFQIDGNSAPVYLQYTDFPVSHHLSFRITTVKQTNTAPTCANYVVLLPT
jgi:hypothetical protein